MRFVNTFSKAGNPYSGIEFTQRHGEVRGRLGEILQRTPVEAPAHWSQTSVDVLVTKYLRRAGVPSDVVLVHDPAMPAWLCPRRAAPGATFGGETSAEEAFERLAGAWTYTGWKNGYFGKITAIESGQYSWSAQTEESARAFYEEILNGLAMQRFAPASPQWFGTGLYWAYGITSPSADTWAFCTKTEKPQEVIKFYKTGEAYRHPIVHSCFILSLKDSLVEPGGITDLVEREARVFKSGGGTGVNASNLRGKGEKLAGGGMSSGAMSFMRIHDRAAGAIKSGGVTRRAAKLWCLDDNHPEILDFISWKVREEEKVACLIAGSKLIRRCLRAIGLAHESGQDALNQAVKFAKQSGVPGVMIDHVLKSISDGYVIDIAEMTADYEGEAYETVSGQNANNSVRASHKFMQAVERDEDWDLVGRVSGVATKTVKARTIWTAIADAAWRSADPGVLFGDTVNEWNLCCNDGEIVGTNPCAEYHWLNDTGCNLASQRLLAYYNPDTGFNIDGYKSDVRLLTTILDITVTMAGYPSEEVAKGSYNYRTLGLGYCDLGALCMRMGLPYGSELAKSVTESITGIMHYESLCASGEIAEELGVFPRYKENEDHCLRVVQNHCAVFLHGRSFRGLTVEPKRAAIWADGELDNCAGSVGKVIAGLSQAAQVLAAKADNSVTSRGLRNAQCTLIAPTGTISLLMGCDTTGIEPDFALVKYKTLAGGGYLKQVNQSVPMALKVLGYTPEQITAIVDYVSGPNGTGTIEGAPGLKEEHLPVFDCANRCGLTGKRSLSAAAHLEMMAAAQPLLSGSISKTINLPSEFTRGQVAAVYRRAYELGLKCAALYRDGSKLSAPLSVTDVSGESNELPLPVASDSPQVAAAKIVRRMLPDRRNGWTQKVRIAGHKFYLRTGEYPEGDLGEIFIDCHGEGAMLRSVMNSFAIAISLGLQYGVPLEEFVEAFVFSKWPPAGPVIGDERIKMSQSPLDYIFRALAIEYLGRDDLAHIEAKPVTQKSSEVRITAIAKPVVTVHDGPAAGYEGDPCPNCRSLTLRRTGKCLTCDTCFNNSGCS